MTKKTVALLAIISIASVGLWATGEVESTEAAEAEMVTIQLTKLDGTTVAMQVEKPRYGGWAVEAYANGGTSTHPAGPSHLAWPNSAPYDRLFGIDYSRGVSGTGEFPGPGDPSLQWIIGDVAETREQTGPTTARFKIRRGVHFWEKDLVAQPVAQLESAYGRELNAHDVVWSANSVIAHPACACLGGQTWTAIDDFTVEVTWENPDYTWEAFRGTGAMSLRPVETEGLDETNWRNGLGTGPFIWSDYQEGQFAQYVRNPNYWKADPLHPDNRLPYIDGLRILDLKESEAVGAGLRTGQIDRNGGLFAFLPARWQESMAETNPEINSGVGQWRQSIFHMRTDKPPFNNMKVRQALWLAIPHEEVNEQFYGGLGFPYSWPASPINGPFFVEKQDLPSTPLLTHEGSGASAQSLIGRDVDLAKRLLAEAGYPDGFEFELLSPPEWQEFAELYPAYWEEIGVTANVNVQESAVVSSMMLGFEYQDMVANDWGNIPSAFSTLTHYYNAESSWNYSRASNATFDQYRSEIAGLPPEDGVARYREYFAYALERADTINVVAEPTFLFWQPWIKGYNGEMTLGWDRWLAMARHYWVDIDMKRELSGRAADG